jgi:hypothetical protein
MDLLNDVHDVQRDLDYIPNPVPGHGVYRIRTRALISVTRKTRSWDFMLPDIVRPVASTTIGCLISMAHRLGMTWLEFKLDEGKLRAAGNGKSFSTSLVRVMGFVVEYSSFGSRTKESYDLFRIPSVAADKVCGYRMFSRTILTCENKMACGIIESHWLFYHRDYLINLPGLPLRTGHGHVKDGLALAFSRLGLTISAREALYGSLSYPEVSKRLPGFADILGLSSDWLIISGLSINLLDNPFHFPIQAMGETPEVRIVWMSLLKQRESTLSGPKKRVLQFYEDWLKAEPDWFRKYYRVLGNSFEDMEMTEFFQGRFEEASQFLKQNVGSMYTALVKAHIEASVHSLQEAEANIKASHNKTRDDIAVPGTNDLYQGDPTFTERAFLYAENVSKVLEYMKKIDTRGVNQRPSYEDAW